jgi:FkbM family methyltransferase
MNTQSIKQQIGKNLFRTCESFPQLKPLVKNLGLRTSKEWFAGWTGRAQTLDGKFFKLTSIAENYLSFELFWRGAGYYEPITTLLASELLQPGDTFIDAGANIGFYTLTLSTARPGLKVIAFEPNPKNFALLTSNVRANNLADVVCEAVALSDSDGAGTLFLSASDMSASLRDDFDEHHISRVPVKKMSLDSYFAHRKIPHKLLIKVDVEGHEAAFFRGARQTLFLRQPDIIAEVALPYDDDTTSLLSAAGYRFYPITDQRPIETAELKPTVRGQFVFLNYLLSARPREEIAAAFDRICPRVRRIDLKKTSKFRSEESLPHAAGALPVSSALFQPGLRSTETPSR